MKNKLTVEVEAAMKASPRAVVEMVENLLSAGVDVRVETDGDPEKARAELIERFAEHGVDAIRVDELLFGDEVRSKRKAERDAIEAAREALATKEPGVAAPTGPNKEQMAAAAAAKAKATEKPAPQKSKVPAPAE